MFKKIRIAILLYVLFMVAVGTWLTRVRSTDWNNSLWVKIYPINGDGRDDLLLVGGGTLLLMSVGPDGFGAPETLDHFSQPVDALYTSDLVRATETAARVGEALSASVEITRLRPDKNLVDLRTRCVGEDGRLISEGRALVYVADVAV